ncbi:hypothetical protein [Mesorhizobium sp. B2-8-9]|uniref:hypothetical protein n=1 Tax=Mesorhizobium sp. B2-8-9 TaxID=2589899 RepID=UPI0011285CDB|nr:hypothetical protein [Mesorhizobium sp. B2-8-9]TPI85480.1 hypothetical protein FJ423_03985 [Mesorhizobium sp. B2-8-9]
MSSKRQSSTAAVAVTLGAWCAFMPSPGVAQTADQLRQDVANNVCNADMPTYDRISAAECFRDGQAARDCDAKFKAPSKEWQACYDKIMQCSKAIDEQNKVISAYNQHVYSCRAQIKKKETVAQNAMNRMAHPDKQGSEQSETSRFAARLKRARNKAANADKTNKANTDNLLAPTFDSFRKAEEENARQTAEFQRQERYKRQEQARQRQEQRNAEINARNQRQMEAFQQILLGVAAAVQNSRSSGSRQGGGGSSDGSGWDCGPSEPGCAAR